MTHTRDIFGALAAATITLTAFGAPLVAAALGLVQTPEITRLVPHEPAPVVHFALPDAEPSEDPDPMPEGTTLEALLAAPAPEPSKPEPLVEPPEPEPEPAASPDPAPVAAAPAPTEPAVADAEAVPTSEDDAVAKVTPTEAPEAPSEEDTSEAPDPSVPPPLAKTVRRIEGAAAAEKVGVLQTTRDLKDRAERTTSCGEVHPSIERTGPRSWRVERELIDHYTQSIAHLNELGWSRKYRGDDLKGWEIGGFGCRNPLWKGGLRNRDVVRTVNGRKTNTVLQLLGLWLGQRNRDHFEVVVFRRGETVTLHYDIH